MLYVVIFVPGSFVNNGDSHAEILFAIQPEGMLPDQVPHVRHGGASWSNWDLSNPASFQE